MVEREMMTVEPVSKLAVTVVVGTSTLLLGPAGRLEKGTSTLELGISTEGLGTTVELGISRLELGTSTEELGTTVELGISTAELEVATGALVETELSTTGGAE